LFPHTEINGKEKAIKINLPPHTHTHTHTPAAKEVNLLHLGKEFKRKHRIKNDIK
jgi:hypothetical protein